MSTFSKISVRSDRPYRRLPRRIYARIHAWLVRVAERSRHRRTLATLSDAQLKDVGLTRHDVAAELAKPIWRN